MLKKNWDIQVWVLCLSSRGCPENVLWTSQIKPHGRSLECQIRTSLGRHFRTSLGRQIETSHDGQIGSSGDVLEHWRETSSECPGSQYLLSGKLVISGILSSTFSILNKQEQVLIYQHLICLLYFLNCLN